MSQKVREEMLPRLRQRYVNRGRDGKPRMIDELREQFGYRRKHAIKPFTARAGWGRQVGQPQGASGDLWEEVRGIEAFVEGFGAAL